MRRNSGSGPRYPQRYLDGRRIDRGPLSGSRTTSRPEKVTVFEADVDLKVPPHQVFNFCLSEDGFSRIMPDRITFIASSGEERTEGAVYLFRWWMMNIVPFIWVALIDHVEPGREFSDLQLRGFFRYFHHTHSCIPNEGGTRYRDTIVFASPFGTAIDRAVLLPLLRRVFAHRHRRMADLLGGGVG